MAARLSRVGVAGARGGKLLRDRAEVRGERQESGESSSRLRGSTQGAHKKDHFAAVVGEDSGEEVGGQCVRICFGGATFACVVVR